MDHPRNDDDEAYALQMTPALDQEVVFRLVWILHEADVEVAIERVACTAAGETHLTYRREGPHHVGHEAGHLCGAYIQADAEVDGALGALEATVLGSDGQPRATWRLAPDWIEAHQADRIDDDELMDRVSTTVEVV